MAIELFGLGGEAPDPCCWLVVHPIKIVKDSTIKVLVMLNPPSWVVGYIVNIGISRMLDIIPAGAQYPSVYSGNYLFLREFLRRGRKARSPSPSFTHRGNAVAVLADIL